MKLEFFTDRDLGKRFPEILASAGLSVRRHDDLFPPDCPDEQWLAHVGQSGWIAITHNARIRYMPNERDAVVRHSVSLLVVVGKAPFQDLAQNFVATMPRISEFLDRHRAPLIAKVYRPTPAEVAKHTSASGSAPSGTRSNSATGRARPLPPSPPPAALAKGGNQTDVLPHSWRSRPPLVQYINSVFCQAFANEIPAEQISLSPKRDELTGEPAVLRWRLEGRKDEDRAAAIARGIADLVQSGYRVVDPETGDVRPARWRDVAVLAATNKHVEQIAKALRTANVPMKMTLQGLLTVPEVCLAKASLRRLNDATDTLATAEIIALTDCREPETWLADRLQWLAQDQPATSGRKRVIRW